MIYTLKDRQITLEGNEHFIADNATLIGSVHLKNKTSVWFNAVIRADHESITIGEESNIQDGAVLHADPGFPINMGKGITVGHKAMVHGCTIGDHSLIGINAVVLNGAQIGKHCIIGANALITENTVIPDGSVVMGSPGKVVKTLDAEKRKQLEQAALQYVMNSSYFNEHLAVDKRFQ
ncbi:gamma carbonic anhydrase family protein [Endozoicomonas arenosclerae]|uniref:gamma carbonic anhydrase family protein n=1 Tax=Endozoicomonas arenosclerae TaxID=1633495 RepID=UPI000783EB44|nr:gamma carbonic anhydrase family protein [Endozoicomonas arenosclerae]